MNKPFTIGIAYLLLVTLLAFVLDHYVSMLGTILWALILGLLLGNLFNLKEKFPKALAFGEKHLLNGAIILLGLQMNFMSITSYLWLIPILILMIGLSIFLGKFFAPKFGVDKECGILLGAGNAICGTSAIATLAPVIQAKNYQTAISISVIHLLGTLGLLAIPFLVTVLNFEDETWGIITGGTFQAVGQAVGAGYTVNAVAGEVATIVKLSRVLMLAPVVLFFTLGSKKNGNSGKVKFPKFIIGFIVAVVLGNFVPQLNDIEYIAQTQDVLLVIAMAAIGTKIFYKDLLVSGPKALKLGTFIFIFQILFIALFIFIKNGMNY
jgi:uncharacterized integral membrane protein (TIGR00698 family)